MAEIYIAINTSSLNYFNSIVTNMGLNYLQIENNRLYIHFSHVLEELSKKSTNHLTASQKKRRTDIIKRLIHSKIYAEIR